LITLFTPQEKNVIILTAQGYNTKEVASVLEISDLTVSVHKKNIVRKAACKNMYQVVAVYAHVLGYGSDI